MDVKSFCTVNGDWLVTLGSDNPERDERRIHDEAPERVETVIGKGRIHVIGRITQGLVPWDFFKSLCITMDGIANEVLDD